MKFEVGKRYYREKPVYFWWCVGFSRTGQAVLESDPSWQKSWHKSGPLLTHEGDSDWQEYKEPKVHKVLIHWWKYSRGDLIPEMYRKNPLPVGYKRGEATLVHVQEVEYKET